MKNIKSIKNNIFLFLIFFYLTSNNLFCVSKKSYKDTIYPYKVKVLDIKVINLYDTLSVLLKQFYAKETKFSIYFVKMANTRIKNILFEINNDNEIVISVEKNRNIKSMEIKENTKYLVDILNADVISTNKCYDIENANTNFISNPYCDKILLIKRNNNIISKLFLIYGNNYKQDLDSGLSKNDYKKIKPFLDIINILDTYDFTNSFYKKK